LPFGERNAFDGVALQTSAKGLVLSVGWMRRGAGSAALLGSNVRTRIFGSTRSTFTLAPDVATRRRGIGATLDRSEWEFPAERLLENMSYAHGRMADDGALAC